MGNDPLRSSSGSGLTETLDNSYCCVMDLNDRDDEHGRCCDLRRSSKSKSDLGFGYIGENKNMSRRGRERYNIIRTTKNILIIQFIFWIIFGTCLLITPKSVVFTLFTSDEYLEENGYIISKEEKLTEQQFEDKINILTDETKEERENEGLAIKALHTALSSIFGEGESATESSKREAERTLIDTVNARAERIAKMKPPVLLTSPARLLGAACCGFAVLSYIMRAGDIKILFAQTTGVLIWYCFIVIALILTAVDRVGGSESTNFMLIMLFVCGAMCFVWFSIRESLQKCIYDEQHLFKNKGDESSEDEDESSSD